MTNSNKIKIEKPDEIEYFSQEKHPVINYVTNTICGLAMLGTVLGVAGMIAKHYDIVKDSQEISENRIGRVEDILLQMAMNGEVFPERLPLDVDFDGYGESLYLDPKTGEYVVDVSISGQEGNRYKLPKFVADLGKL